MREFYINERIQLSPISRAGFLRIMNQHIEAARSFERLPNPPKDHKCKYCPIDPHTMRYVIVSLAALRDVYLKSAMDTPITHSTTGFYKFTCVDALDVVLATLCGEFAPELGEDLLENYQ